MQKSKDKEEKKPLEKKEDSSITSKNKPAENNADKKKIDEQDSDGSGGAFEEFIDQQKE
jgi:hypothetical protein